MRRLLPHLLRETDVGLIRTAASDVIPAQEDELVEKALAKCNLGDFDMLPVLKDGDVHGTFWRDDGSGVVGKTVHQVMQPPNVHVVPRSTPLSDVFQLLAQSRALAVTVDGGMTLDGIVTYADLNRRPVRVLLYAFLSEFECKLCESLRSKARNPDRFLDQYGKYLNENTLGRWMKAKYSGIGIHPVENSGLSDMLKIFGEVDELRAGLGFATKEQANRASVGLVEMRTGVMHPVRPLVKSVGDTKKLADRFETLTHLLGLIEQATQHVS